MVDQEQEQLSLDLKKKRYIHHTASLTSFSSLYSFRENQWATLDKSSSLLRSKHYSAEKRQEEIDNLDQIMQSLEPIETYYAFPGKKLFYKAWNLLKNKELTKFDLSLAYINHMLLGETYRTRTKNSVGAEGDDAQFGTSAKEEAARLNAHYFEVLYVDKTVGSEDEQDIRNEFIKLRKIKETFVYDVIVVHSFEDALIAVTLNPSIQTVIISNDYAYHSKNKLNFDKGTTFSVDDEFFEKLDYTSQSIVLAEILLGIRRELDIFMCTDKDIEEIASTFSGIHMASPIRRVFYKHDSRQELHLSILRALEYRYETPCFNAVLKYSREPTGVFHALPISRGNSLLHSNWIKDMYEFYGSNIFLAETSSTGGGLDSLLEPTGSIKRAQQLANKAFGAQHTYFVTNGTSTANKIVVQALCRDGDIVLVDRNCHKSHHYGFILTGAHPYYLEAYPLQKYSIYGGVPLIEIKKGLLDLKRTGQLHRVKMLLLTNCTFDGIVYNVKEIMEQCLAIKPDLIFLWDEAWFAFAYFHPLYRGRTAMDVARHMWTYYFTPDYAKTYAAYLKIVEGLDWTKDETWLNTRLMPDPSKLKIRIYATQSTHKTLTALRQGSMIHVHDQEYQKKVISSFHEAYYTHTSTSPNYQILASLDVGRRQVHIEGYELVQRQVALALTLRKTVQTHPLLKKHFRILEPMDLIPKEFRQSGFGNYYNSNSDEFNSMEEAWENDEFVLDPSRLTLYCGKLGVDGNTFRSKYLMDKYEIQVNKTSTNTVLLITNIGTTRSAVAYLVKVLVTIAQKFEEKIESSSPSQMKLHNTKLVKLNEKLPPLPNFSYFHKLFSNQGTKDGNIRKAFQMAFDEDVCEYMSVKDGSIYKALLEGKRDLVSANLVIPYPPGFPILVPGQVITPGVIDFMMALDVKEIHGYHAAIGLRIFKPEILKEDDSNIKEVTDFSSKEVTDIIVSG